MFHYRSEEDEYDTIATIKNIDVFDYQYENSKNEAPQVAGGVSSEWIEEYYMKKKWESKEVEIRAKKGETVDKATDLHPGKLMEKSFQNTIHFYTDLFLC